MSGGNNYFIKVVDCDGDKIVFRPDALTHLVEYEDADYVSIFVGKHHYEIPKGQISLDILVNHSQHAGVRTLN